MQGYQRHSALPWAQDPHSEPFSLTDDELDESTSDKPPRSPTTSLSEVESETPENIPLPETPTPRSTPASAPTPTPSSPPPKLSAVDGVPPLPTHSPPISVADKSNTTTPPGSPEKPPGPIPAPLAPKPIIPPSTVSSFGFGLGRPSSRPIRSSPLTSAPITSTNEEDPVLDVTPSKSAPAIVNFKPVEPKTPLGQALSPTTVPATEPLLSSGNGTSSSANRRPMTPPLLGTSPAPGAGSTTLRGPFVLGQPQALPVPLKTSSQLVPLSVPVSGTHQPVSPAVKEDDSEELPKHPLQIEFQRAYQEMVKELVQLHKKACEMAVILPAISEPRGLDTLVLNNQEFVPGKYSHGDLKSFAIMIGALQKTVVPLLDQGKSNKGLLQDLQNLALISETKQEELSRWARAQEDPEHAKTLKPRALGPEHSENQIRLRKALQMAHDRIQQCEDEFESLKKRLGQHKSGRVGLRNIQAALEERTKLLEQLKSRMDALSPQTSQRLQSSYHTRTPYQKPGTVTPPFASVAAAALNSERSSLKLKNALLSARKEPLFTTNVVKPKTTSNALQGPQVSPQRPDWTLPLVPPLSGPSNSVNRRSSRPGKKHGAVQLRASSSPGADAKSVAFDWGPLPSVAPMAQLSQDVRSVAEN
ncbi:hypothetical protein JB92DRAFT_1573691 [Gautieria morchelliformis]|nr:hypothetical protein JB92DRAFT_1573691 [Gautieria morchelliformis]